MKTLPTLPTADREAKSSSLATLDQSALSVTGDTDSTVVYPSLMLAIMSFLAPGRKANKHNKSDFITKCNVFLLCSLKFALCVLLDIGTITSSNKHFQIQIQFIQVKSAEIRTRVSYGLLCEIYVTKKEFLFSIAIYSIVYKVLWLLVVRGKI